MNHRQRTTLAAFFAYAVMSGMLAPIGLLSPELAEIFGLAGTEITRRFSWLTIGILIGALLAVEITPRVSLRPLLIVLYSTLALAVMSLRLHSNEVLIWPAVGLVGIICGIGLSSAALIIARSYQSDQRASMLVITDGCFSLAGVGVSLIAGFALAADWHWSATYMCVGILAIGIVLLSVNSTFPAAPAGEATQESRLWPPSAWACVAGLFFYTLGQNAMLWWLPQHLTEAMGAEKTQASRVVANYWLGMFLAQIFTAWFVFRIGLNRLLAIAVVSCALASAPLWLLDSSQWVVAMALIFGFFNLGLLKLLISFASEKLPTPTPRLISTLLLGATTGTALSPAITSSVVEWTSVRGVLIFGSCCFTLLAVVVLALLWRDLATTDASHVR